jgi:hypothetical protein
MHVTINARTVGCEVLTAEIMKNTGFWVMMLCSPDSSDVSGEHIVSIFRDEK